MAMNPTPDHDLTPRHRQRRRLLGAALLAAASSRISAAPSVAGDSDAARSAHFPFGPVVPPRPIPPWPVRTEQAKATDLASLLRGRTSALQLMFTGCSATCPIQGALFGQAQRELQGRPPEVQFVSVSIDPLADTPAALAGWLRTFSGLPGWIAVAPRLDDVDRIFAVLGNGGEPRPTGSDRHTGQVYIIDRRGELAYRTPSMPPAEQIVAALRRVAERP